MKSFSMAPALFTRMSTPPKALSAASNIATTLLVCPRSPTAKAVLPARLLHQPARSPRPGRASRAGGSG